MIIAKIPMQILELKNIEQAEALISIINNSTAIDTVNLPRYNTGYTKKEDPENMIELSIFSGTLIDKEDAEKSNAQYEKEVKERHLKLVEDTKNKEKTE